MIVKNISGDGDPQDLQDVALIAQSMRNSEESKFIALKVIKKGLKSSQRQKFKKTLILVNSLTYFEELRKFFSTSLNRQLGNLVIL